MVCIGRRSLDTVGDQLLQAGHVRPQLLQPITDTQAGALRSHGLARLRVADGKERYLATSGGVLYFHEDTLKLYARRIFLSDDLDEIRSLLEHQLREEEEQLVSLKDAMGRVEEQIFYRLRNMLKEHG